MDVRLVEKAAAIAQDGHDWCCEDWGGRGVRQQGQCGVGVGGAWGAGVGRRQCGQMIGFLRGVGLAVGGSGGGSVVHWHGVRVCRIRMVVVVMEGVGISGEKSSVEG